jgi:ABC transporter substrate binding protein (PQQ-dependent alcohol dehydrogenase system)
MIARLVVAALLLNVPFAFASEPARIVYIGIENDHFYEPQTVYTGLSLLDRKRPVDAAQVALRGTRILERAIGLSFALDIVLLPPDQSPVTAVREAQDSGALAVLLDLPAEAMAAVANAEGAKGLLFNIRHREARWRAGDCAPALLHTLPSHAMLSDALAQHLKFHGWQKILLLMGSGDENRLKAEAVRQSATKFGLNIVAEREFKLTNDPRQRDLSNIALLTGGVTHDVVWLVDSEGEFGRYVPYTTQSPRPIVGSEGLKAQAWHWTLERYGAPQLNQRFRREHERDMTSEDFAAWAAVRAVVTAVTELRVANPKAVADHLRSDKFAMDIYKGVRGSFRSWNGQLRQPILLATHNAVISIAPLSGFEHSTDTLDTLGVDKPQSLCRH